MLAIATLLSPALFASADDWPEWRGRGRRGVWNEGGVLDRFPDAGLVVTWRVPIGFGYGGPAVADGRVFVTDYQSGDRGARGTERILALDEATGRILWTHQWPIAIGNLMPVYANGPRATPTVDGDRVYVLGSTGRLFCLRVADGAVVWERDYVRDFNAPIPIWGVVGAPLVDADRLICLVGGEPNAKVVVLDKLTGREIWRALPPHSEPGYAPPVIVDLGPTRQLIIWDPISINSLDPATGRLNWQLPYEVEDGQTIAQPVHDGNRLLITSKSHGSTMLQLDPQDASRVTVLWKGRSSNKNEPDGLHGMLTTPYFEGDYIYGVGGEGVLWCLDARTGTTVWQTLAATGERARVATAFLVKNGDRFFINNDRGDLIMARMTPRGYEELSRAKLIEPTNPNTFGRRALRRVNWSHPAYANGHIYHRNDHEIIAVSLRK